MTRRVLLQSSIAGAASLCASAQQRPLADLPCDLCIYGATPSGIAAAVAAARLGQSVLLCEYEDHIGGVVSNGLTNADIAKRQAVGGFFYEFTRRVVSYYEQMDRDTPGRPNVKLCRDGYWYEANAAERIFHEMIQAEQGRIRLLPRHELKRAIVTQDRLSAIVLEDRTRPGNRVTIHARVFIDATYEGDLAAMSGAPFHTGRESRSEYGEAHAGRIYIKFGASEPLSGSTGEADDATQSYCFRFHVTKDPAKLVTIEKPAGYNRDDYRFLLEDIRAGRLIRFSQAVQVYPMPNGRFELNSNHVNPETGVPRESLDLAEECWDWPTATWARRRAIYERYRSHNVGLIWLLQNDPEVPEALRKEALQYGWHRDEWPANGHIPRHIYVRQGRRILGDYILTEHDADLDTEMQRTRVQPASIAIIEWQFDPHGHHRYDPDHPGVREGYMYVGHQPFQVPYGVLVPRRIEGLLVPVACSCSHVAYNALRQEPVFMALGEVCGIAAHLAIRHSAEVRRVPVAELQALLVERRGVITFYEDLPFTDPAFAAFQWLGARGLNPGYRANKDAKLTRAEASGRLVRILKVHDKMWTAPLDRPDAPLVEADLQNWLKQAGYISRSTGPSPIDLAQFASIVYQAMAPELIRRRKTETPPGD